MAVDAVDRPGGAVRAVFDRRGGCGGGDAVGVWVRAAGHTLLPGLGVPGCAVLRAGAGQGRAVRPPRGAGARQDQRGQCVNVRVLVGRAAVRDPVLPVRWTLQRPAGGVLEFMVCFRIYCGLYCGIYWYVLAWYVLWYILFLVFIASIGMYLYVLTFDMCRY